MGLFSTYVRFMFWKGIFDAVRRRIGGRRSA